MLDIKLVRENPELIKKSEKKRGRDAKIVDKVLQLDTQWKKELKKVETLKHQRNVVSQEINQSKKDKDEKSAKIKIKEMQEMVADIKKKEEKAEKFLEQRNKSLLELGNIIHQEVPAGKDDSDNVEIKKGGEKPKFNFPVKNHVQLVEELEVANFDASAQAAGNGFYYLQGALGLLNQALIQFAIKIMLEKKYIYVEPPLMIREKVLTAAVDTTELAETIYRVEDEDLVLIGTSEHALLALHQDQTFIDKELPKKYFSYSMCFRKEVGAHGINEKGLWRTHQFNKVEQFIFCRPEESEEMFQELLRNSEDILKKLELPYRIIEICSGDLSLWKHRSYDFEVWRPTTQDYGEIMSLSNCTDFQARKLGIKVERNGKRDMVHTLNNTALATSRIIVAILENYQTKNGTVKIPKVLWPYMHGIKEISK